MAAFDLEPLAEKVAGARTVALYGKVVDVVGLTIEATGPPMNIGDLCYVAPSTGGPRIPVEVVGFRGERLLLMPLGDIHGIGPKSALIPTFEPQRVPAGMAMLGRVVNCMGEPIDGGPPVSATESMPLAASAPHPLKRMRVTEPLATGVRAIDGCITCGKGQRIGVMSGSGVGKSKLIGMVGRNTSADVNVIGLIGERGKEVRDFIESDLGPEGLKRSVVVVSTSDEPALMRIKGANLATTLAEWFREQGADVMLMVDSITRFAVAQREVGLAIGEPPTTKGYPPSVYALLPKLLERAGTSERGSITAFYSVLIEGDDLNDPIGDAVRSILDGHIVLSRSLASKGHYPAIDVLESISRSMIDVVEKSHLELATRMRDALATYRDAEDLVNIGAYVTGTNANIDAALRKMPNILGYLRQGLQERAAFEEIEPAMAKALR